ncbi:MAG: response regulator [Pseudomonadales bacterium]|nr:response regulator [Pseudomonadales bacterium]
MADREKPVILVVDDQTTVVRVMGRMLSDHYVVHVATTGQRALEIAEENQPDLILLDMVMPQMSGIDVCLRLKEKPATQHIPVIFVTSMDDRHNEARGFKAGAVDYITKPPSPEIVHARVAVHLANNRQVRFIERLASGELSDSAVIRIMAERLLSNGTPPVV